MTGNLNVWHAESPLGPWEPHPLNPVANGPRAAGFRNGGRLVEHEGRLYRFGQDCGETYGHKVGWGWSMCWMAGWVLRREGWLGIAEPA